MSRQHVTRRPRAARRAPRLAVALGMFVASVTVVTASSSPADAAELVSVRHLAGADTMDGLIAYETTPSGRFVMAYRSQVEPFRIDVSTGAATPVRFLLPFDAAMRQDEITLSDDGAFAYGIRTLVTGTVVWRVTIDTGVVDVFGVPLPSGWGAPHVADTDATGGLLLINASRTTGSGAFLYDLTTQQLLSPGSIGGSSIVRGRDLSPDGRLVTYVQQTAFDVELRVFVLDRLTGDTRSVAPPAVGADTSWDVSPDLRWMLFVAESPGVVPGYDGSRRVYRRNLETGETDVPPLATVPQPGAYEVFNGGRVLAILNGQMYAWDGTGAPVLVSRGADGNPASSGVGGYGRPIQANDDATSIVVATTSSNLVVPLPFSAFPRLFQLTLTAAPGTANSWAVVRAGERYCVSAVGADPGDFVGVNITPVLAAAPGFGTLHSSDDPAGTTSNVNFGPDTVDPNVAFTEVGSDGRICFTNSNIGPVHVILDEMIVADAAAFRAPTATGSTRLIDTRTGLGGPTLQPAESRCVAATGAQPGEFVGVNVLPVNATGPGFGTIHPSGSPAGASSTANYTRNSFDPNFAFTKVGPDGQICFTNAPFGTVDLVLDALIVGTITVMRTPTPGSNSDRPVDTRTGIGGTRLAPGARVCFAIPGSNPGDVGFVNILAVDAAGPGFATVHSSADTPGATSNANYTVGSFDPNMGIASFGPDNQICLTNGPISATDVIVDSQVIATATAFTKPTPSGTVRLVDTRVARA